MIEREKQAQAWLNRNYGKAMEIEAIKRSLERMETNLERSVKPLKFKEVQEEPYGNTQEEMIADFLDLQISLRMKIKALADDDRKTLAVIGMVEQAFLRTILIERYVNRLSWKDISNTLHVERGGHLYRMHLEALSAVLPYIPEVEKEGE